MSGFDRRMRRLERGRGGGLMFLTIEGDPEIQRLQWLGVLPPGAMGSEREALIGLEWDVTPSADIHFVALDTETTAEFHARLKAIAKERGFNLILLGDQSHLAKPSPAPRSPGPPEGATIN